MSGGLSTRALGRATLARQRLLERRPGDATETISDLVGLQGQVPGVPYLALWARLAGFEPEHLAAPMRERRVVRTSLMRCTIHTVTAADAVALRPVMQPVLDRTFAGTAWGQRLRGVDVAALEAAAAALVEAQPATRSELARAIEDLCASRGLAADDVSAAFVHHVPLVHVTPRGVWGASGRAALTTYATWLGPAVAAAPGVAPERAVEDVVLRYLAAFGPASVRDVQAWCGLTRLSEVVERLGARVRRLRAEEGRELVDVPDGVLPDPDIPAPVRFLPEYDNALLSYADRARVAADAPHDWMQGGPGGFIGTVLVDGVVQATWAARRTEGAMALEVRESLPLTPAQRDDVEAEGRRLLTFIAPDAAPTVTLRARGG